VCLGYDLATGAPLLRRMAHAADFVPSGERFTTTTARARAPTDLRAYFHPMVKELRHTADGEEP
jgi:hypothetical protein